MRLISYSFYFKQMEVYQYLFRIIKNRIIQKSVWISDFQSTIYCSSKCSVVFAAI